MLAYITGKKYPPPIVMGTEALMKKKAHGTTETPVQDNLRWSVDQKKADKICCFNRHFAEHSGYFLKTKWLQDMKKKNDEPTEYYDSVSGKLLFTAPVNRTFDEFLVESKKHGWPSYRDQEVNWEFVRVLPGGEVVSVDGTHLGHNLPDKKGNRYCINLVSVAGNPVDSTTAPMKTSEVLQTFQLQKNEDRCTGLFYRSNPTKKTVKVLSRYSDWPRDNAFVQGTVEDVNGLNWLKVERIKQPGSSEFVAVKGKDVWLPSKHEQYFLVEQNDASNEDI